MLTDQKGNVINYGNRKQRRKYTFQHQHHNIFTKGYHNERSFNRSLKYYEEVLK